MRSDGSVPVDSNNYLSGETVTVPAQGTLGRVGHTFVEWNTASDGTGTNRTTGTTFAIGTSNVVLYAVWAESWVARWARSVTSGSYTTVFESVAVDSTGNVYAAGSIRGSAQRYTFGPGISVAGSYSTEYGKNVVIVRYSK